MNVLILMVLLPADTLFQSFIDIFFFTDCTVLSFSSTSLVGPSGNPSV